MKTLLSTIAFICICLTTLAQSEGAPIQSLLGKGRLHSSGGYGAISNKFTTINGEYANLAEVYGGWYINHRLLLGVAAAASTNEIPVSWDFSGSPGARLSYEYGQVGLMTEYVLGSRKMIHLAFQLFSGAGFTFQYMRYSGEIDSWDEQYDRTYEENWFFVAEPGVRLEVNIFKWMRFSPGISYRAAFNSSAMELSDDAISGASYNLTLKFGKF